jgi:hypothetical protein
MPYDFEADDLRRQDRAIRQFAEEMGECEYCYRRLA